MDSDYKSDYKSIEQQGNDLVLTDIKNFVPAQVLDCGQSFRWCAEGGGYTGIAHGRKLHIYIDGNRLVLQDVTPEEFEETWRDYFDLGRDYSALRRLYDSDETLKEAIAFSPGLRIMRQDPWEVTVSFILSQNSNIPRIKGMVERLCDGFGNRFPSPEELMQLGEGGLAHVRSGYRAGYIIDAASRASDGRLDFVKMSSLPSMSTDDIRSSLMEVRGIGRKVADCILLYGFGRVECYPMDVWMKRIMERYYPEGFPSRLADTAGIAQQFLFHFARTSL